MLSVQPNSAGGIRPKDLAASSFSMRVSPTLVFLSFLLGLSLAFGFNLSYIRLLYTLDRCDKLLKLSLCGIIVLYTLLPRNDKPPAPVEIHGDGLGQGDAGAWEASGVIGDKIGTESAKT